MNILVYDIAASETGALSVLKDFHDEVLKTDKENRWIFAVSSPELPGAENVEIKRYPWVKKSWLHRLWFDYFTSRKLIRDANPGLIFSLQNLIVPHSKTPQIIYLHQSLPFVLYRFKFNEDRLLWIYQNVIGRKIFKSVKKAEKVIVQTQWMKQACVEKTGIPAEKIAVIPPAVDLSAISEYEDAPENRKVFFFPAGPFSYKNHMLILKACKRLKERGITGYRAILTLTGAENSYTENLKTYAGSEGLNVSFTGALKREETFSLYSKSVLVFPSYIETFGLPLLEAHTAGAIVLASDMPFSREILSGYANSYFFDINDDEKLSEYMEACISGEIKYSGTPVKNRPSTGLNLVGFLLSRAGK